ncbi:MAG: adenosylcobinamide-phosphate synthase CbiB [Gammaproteobacteria bacterium]|jgi:adenosylcobinamide-phosphate synthase
MFAGLDALIENPFSVVLSAFSLDLAFGDPRYRWHPIRLLGDLATHYERALRALGVDGYLGGVLHWFGMVVIAVALWAGVHAALLSWHPFAAWGWDVLLAWHLLSLRDLLDHARRVLWSLPNIEEARRRVGWLVGRDTKRMDRPAVVRATIESLSESIIDGVLTPLWALCLGGLPAAITVKVISTLDSMVGYKNSRYRRFGWAGARSDDLVNWLPARLSVAVIAAAAVLLRLHPVDAVRSAWRFHGLLPSPNSGWSEGAYAGALRIRLVGPLYRNGVKVNELYIGEPHWPAALDERHLQGALRLTLLCGGLGLAAGLAAICGLHWINTRCC